MITVLPFVMSDAKRFSDHEGGRGNGDWRYQIGSAHAKYARGHPSIASPITSDPNSRCPQTAWRQLITRRSGWQRWLRDTAPIFRSQGRPNRIAKEAVAAIYSPISTCFALVCNHVKNPKLIYVHSRRNKNPKCTRNWFVFALLLYRLLFYKRTCKRLSTKPGYLFHYSHMIFCIFNRVEKSNYTTS